MTVKIKSYIGFAIKSGQIVYGVDNILKKKSRLIIYSDQLGESSAQKLISYAQKLNLPAIKLNDTYIKELVSEGVKALALTNIDLAKATLEALKTEGINW